MEEWLAGLREGRRLVEAGGISVVLGAALAVYFVTKWAFLRSVRRFALATQTHWDDELVNAGVFSKIAYVAPAFVVYYGLGFFPDLPEALVGHLQRVAVAFMIAISALALTSLLNAGERIYDRHEEYRERPIKSYLQVGSILIYLLAGLLILSVLMNRSP